jgi:hypothetical protein
MDTCPTMGSCTVSPLKQAWLVVWCRSVSDTVCFRSGRLDNCWWNLPARPRSQETVTHPDQFRTVAPAASLRERTVPLGHQRMAPLVLIRALSEYDQLCGLEVPSCNLS